MDVNLFMYRLVEITFFVAFFVCLRDAWRRGLTGDPEIARIEEELATGDPDAEPPVAPRTRERWKLERVIRNGRGVAIGTAPKAAPHYLWVGIMVAAILFTLAFEWALTHKGEGWQGGDSIYNYEVEALVTLFPIEGIPGSAVPLWVPCGWALIMYLVMRTSDKLNIRWYKRPILDGLMALVIDFALDPVASWNHWWVWDFTGDKVKHLDPTFFFTIPATNYMAWIVIVGGFSMLVRLFQRWREGRYRTLVGRFMSWLLRKLGPGAFGDFVSPILAAIPAFGLVIGYSLVGRVLMDSRLAFLQGKWFTDGAFLCSVIWGACMIWVFADAPIGRRDHQHDYVLMFSPLAIYSVVLIALYTTKVPGNDKVFGGQLLFEAMPELIIIVPLAALLGGIVFAWPYSEPGPESWW